MIQLQNLHLSFNSQVIFNGISWHIKRKERIGLVGPNGAGKTTLLKAIIGQMTPDKGEVQVAKNVTLGYLPQQAVETRGKPLLEEVLSSVAEIKTIENEMLQLQEFLSRSHDNQRKIEGKLKRLGYLQHRFEELGGFHLEYQAKKILTGLGFEEAHWDRPCETFSGGWQMRIALGKLLLQQPNLLLLDEPTNHLDIQAMEWLEGYLYKYPGTIIVVSHDRFFLNRIVAKIVSLERGKLTEYAGSYAFFERERQHYDEQLWMQYERQKEEIERIQKFIDRFRYKASKAAQVQSRIKKLEKMEKIIPPAQRKKTNFHFPAAVRSGRVVFQLNNVSKVYGEHTVFQEINLTIERGARIALVGINGAGKSTLSRILAEFENPSAGEMTRGYQVKLSFYAQETADALSGDQSVLDELLAIAPYANIGYLRTLLGCFLFHGDDVCKPVSVLSGGEKSRLALAKIMFQESNVLILDEPTNHLDIDGKDVLQNALKDYQGTLILVSHDRYFLDHVITRVIEIADGRIQEFLGNYSYYLSKREELLSPENTSEEKLSTKPVKRTKKSRDQRRHEAEARQLKYRIRREKETQLREIESEIELKETRKAEIEAKLADVSVYSNPELSRELMLEYKKITAELAVLYEKWGAMAE